MRGKTNMIKIGIAIIFCFGFFIGCSDETAGPDPKENDPCQDNNSPVVEAIPDTFVALGDTIWIFPEAYDDDFDELDFGCSCNNITLTQLRTGKVPQFGVDSQSGEFMFVPKSYDAPYRIFEISATDSCDAAGSAEFTIQVEQ